MGNCLVTKLKGNVNNPSLVKLGVLELEVKTVTQTSSYYNMLTIIVASETTIKTADGSKRLSFTQAGLSDPQSELTFTGSKSIWTENGDYKIEINNKYNITKLEVNGNSGYSSYNINLSDFEWLTSLNHFTAIGQTSKGDLSSLIRLTNMEKLDVSSSRITGDIAVLETLIHLITLNVGYTGINGELTEFASAMVDSGRTDGTLRIFTNSHITLQDAAITGSRWIKFGTNLPAGAEVTGTGWAIYASNPNA